MKSSGMSDEFAGAFRTALVEHVNRAARTRVPRRRLFVSGAITIAILGAGAATATAVNIDAQRAEVIDYNSCMEGKGWSPKVRVDSGDWIFETHDDEERMRFGNDSNDCIEQISEAP